MVMTKSQLMTRRVLCTFLLAFSSQALSEGFRIEKATVNSMGNLRLEFLAETNSYYVLERAESPGNEMLPVSMVLAFVANGVLEQPVDRARAFFRLRAIPLASPQSQ